MGIKSRAAKTAATVVLGVGLGITGAVAPAVGLGITGAIAPVANAGDNYHWRDDHGHDGWCQQFFGVSLAPPPFGWQWGDPVPPRVVAFWADFGWVWTWGAPNGAHPVQLDNGWVVAVF
jgi:hypothetical protein